MRLSAVNEQRVAAALMWEERLAAFDAIHAAVRSSGPSCAPINDAFELARLAITERLAHARSNALDSVLGLRETRGQGLLAKLGEIAEALRASAPDGHKG